MPVRRSEADREYKSVGRTFRYSPRSLSRAYGLPGWVRVNLRVWLYSQTHNREYWQPSSCTRKLRGMMSLTPHTHGFPQDIIFLGLLDNNRQSAPVRSRSALHECPDALLSSIHTFICFIRLIINSYVHSFIRSAHPFVHSSFWSEYIIRPTSHDAIYNNYKTLKV